MSISNNYGYNLHCILKWSPLPLQLKDIPVSSGGVHTIVALDVEVLLHVYMYMQINYSSM